MASKGKKGKKKPPHSVKVGDKWVALYKKKKKKKKGPK
jgi:hypothetical protein